MTKSKKYDTIFKGVWRNGNARGFDPCIRQFDPANPCHRVDSSVGKSIRLITGRSWVQVPCDPPCHAFGKKPHFFWRLGKTRSADGRNLDHRCETWGNSLIGRATRTVKSRREGSSPSCPANMSACRNWQTRRSQKPLLYACEFKSHR